MKKLLLSFLMLIAAVPLWAYDFSVDGIFYNITDETNKTVEVTYEEYLYTSTYTGTVTIPETVTYNGNVYTITSIGENAFRKCTDLTGIELPNTLLTIARGAFNTTGLTELTIPRSVTTIAGAIVYNSTSLKTINYNAANATVGDHSLKSYAFSSCSATTLTIGEDVEKIPEYAFYNLSTITTLNYNAKKCLSCSSMVTTMTKVNIGSSVTYFPASMFSGCQNLAEVNISDLSAWCKIDFANNTANPVNYAHKLCLNNSEITDLIIPDDVTKISNYSFINCSGITSITIPNSVTQIGSSAFENCRGLTSVTIPNSVTQIGSYAFWGCSGLTSATISNSVTQIGSYAFCGCSGLTSVTISNSVTQIGNNAFAGCSGLTSVVIPESVNEVGDYAFGNCTALETVDFNAENCAKLGTLSGPVFYGCSALTTLNIGDKVTTIPAYAFYGCSGLTSATMGNSVTTIGEWAFHGCTGLTDVNISDLSAWCKIDFADNTANPVNYAHKLCLNNSEITNLIIPDDVTEISNYSFINCSGINSVTIPNSVTQIGNNAFADCSGLTSIVIPESVNEVGDYAFGNCTALETVDFNAKNCIKMGTSDNPVFYGCSALTTLNIDNNVTTIPAYAFYGCSGLTEVTIPNSVTSIGSSAFNGCTGLTDINISDLSAWCKIDFNDNSSNPLQHGASLNLNDVEITNLVVPDSITEIKQYAFHGYSRIISLSVPNSVITIGNNAFDSCTGLTSVTLGNALESIGDAAFSGCDGILVVNSYNTTAPTGAPFETSVKETATLNIPASALASYQSTDGWKDFANISEFALNGTYDFETDGIYYRIVSLTDLTVEVVAKDGNYNSYSGDITIPETTTYRNREFSVIGISPLAFNGSTGLTSITIPQTVNTIGSKAFEGCSALKTVTIAESENMLTTNNCFANKSITTLSLSRNITGTFSGNDGLVSIKLSETITTINDEMFLGCPALTEITLTDSIASIGTKAFSGCAKLQAINIPAKVSTIGVSAFDGCNSIKSVTITDSDTRLTTNDCFTYKSIEQLYLGRNIVGSFSANPNLASVELSDNVTSINKDMFLGCSTLTQISLHDNISTIGANAFSGCVNLPAITIPAKVTTIGANAFEYCSALKTVTISDSDTKLNTNNNFASSAITTLYLGRNITGTFNNCTNLTEVYLSKNVTQINDSQFKNCAKITSIELPMYVSEIGASAFDGCSTLTSLTIPASVATIGTNAFDGCSALAELVIEDANTAISMAGNSFGTHPLTSLYLGRNTDCTFTGCATLSEVELGANVTTLNTSLFENCTNMSSIDLPQNLTSIGANAFNGCSNLTNLIIPETVTTIGENALSGCSELTEMVIPNKVTSIGAGAFDGCSSLSSLILKSGNGEIDMNGNTFSTAPLTSIYLGRDITDVTSPFSNIATLTQVIIGNGATALQSDAFTGCSAINELVIECDEDDFALNCSFADSPITRVHIGRNGTYAFNNRIELKEVSVGDNVTSIPDNAFNGCSNVETLKLGNKLETIGTDAFIGCTTLTNVSSTNITPPTGASFENRTYMMGTLHVVKGYKEVYMQAKGWLDFFEIVDDLPFEVNGCWYLNCGDNKVKVVANPSGDSYVGNIFIPKSIEYNGETLFVTEIDANAFAGALSANTITIEDSELALTLTSSQPVIETMSNDDVVSIFSDCMLDSVYVGRNLVYDIDNEPFANQKYLRKVTIGSCVTSMGGAMFVGCENIETVYAMGATPATDAEFESVVYDNAALIVPVGSINAYSETDGWKEFFSIKDTEGNITDPSGVENVKIADETDTHSTISVVNGEIIVNCAENIEIAIYNINGNLIYQGLNHQVAVATKGIYIVVVNGKAIKVLI